MQPQCGAFCTDPGKVSGRTRAVFLAHGDDLIDKGWDTAWVPPFLGALLARPLKSNSTSVSTAVN